MIALGKDGSRLTSCLPSSVKGGVARNDKHHCIYFIRLDIIVYELAHPN